MNTAKIFLIILVLNVILVAITSFALTGSETYTDILNTDANDAATLSVDIMSDENIQGRGTETAQYESTAMDTRSSGAKILGVIKNGLMGVDETVYSGSDMITKIVLDIIAYIRALSLILVALLAYQLIKNRKSD